MLCCAVYEMKIISSKSLTWAVQCLDAEAPQEPFPSDKRHIVKKVILNILKRKIKASYGKRCPLPETFFVQRHFLYTVNKNHSF